MNIISNISILYCCNFNFCNFIVLFHILFILHSVDFKLDIKFDTCLSLYKNNLRTINF